MTTDRDREGMSVSAHGADNAQLGVLGAGQQHNYFGSSDNHDVTVVIAHESDQIAVQVGIAKRVSVEVTNHTRHTKRLSLRVNGLPRGIATLDERDMELPPENTQRRTLTVLCTAIAPEAGPRSLVVVAVDSGSGLQWPSLPKTVAIPPRPDVRVVLAGQDDVADAGTYPARVEVWNAGNTRIEGTITARKQADALTPQAAFPGGHGDTVGFACAPGESDQPPVALTFPSQGWRRRHWEVWFQLTVEREDVADTDHQFWIEQQGRLSELWLAAHRWNATRASSVRRGALLSGLAVVLVVLTVFALIATLPTDKEANADNPATSAPNTDRAAPDLYQPLPCAPGHWMAFLGTTVGKQADAEAQLTFDHETARLNYLLTNRDKLKLKFQVIAPGTTYKVRASKMADVCPNTKGYVDHPSPDRRFVWLEPFVGSEDEAKQLCIDIGKPYDYDCLPRPAS